MAKHIPSKNKPFTFDKLVRYFKNILQKLPEHRKGNNTLYSIEDAALAAFSVFFTQCPSFLASQKNLEKTIGKSNAQSLFAMHKIPSDNQIRNLLDPFKPDFLYSCFHYVFRKLKETGYLDSFRYLNNQFLIALDGTEYFSSEKISCPTCFVRNHRNGTVSYSHKAITPVLVAPGNSNVISLEPEFIVPQDGHNKQDSETAAAKRWIEKYSSQYKKYGMTLLGDDLYSRQPTCEKVQDSGFHFIFVCKEESHKTLYGWLKEVDSAGQLEEIVEKWEKGKHASREIYRYCNEIGLYDGGERDVFGVNWCEMRKVRKDGTVVSKSAFVTDHKITKKNVKEIVKAGKSRWKIENENNNTLKTKGYHLEHNFGHGKKNLSSFLLTLNLLAFLFHTLLSMMDKKYQLIREKLPSRKTFFQDIRALTRYSYFENWEHLLTFMMRGLEIELIDTG